MATMHRLSDLAVVELARLASGMPEPAGLPSGIGLEKFCPGGIPRDKVTILFADTGTFKTTVAGHMVMSMAEKHHNSLVVSLEDSARLATQRFLAQRAGIPYGALSGGMVTPADMASLAHVGASRRTLDIASHVYLTDDIEPQFDRVLDAVRAVPNCAAVVLDYLQLLSDSRDLKETLDNAVLKAKHAARQMNTAFILVSQMRVDRRDYNENPRPQLGDMFGSSAMRTGGKLTVALFRPWIHCKMPMSSKGPFAPYAKFCSADPTHPELYPGLLEVSVLKNVSGPVGMTTVHVDAPTGTITPIDLRSYV